MELLDYIRSLESCVVAFSGGVDSTFLLKACKDALSDRVVALTIDAPYIPRWEIEEAKEFTKELGVEHNLLMLPIKEEIKFNPENRCYLCKKVILTMLKDFAIKNGYKHVIDGTNFDDTKDYRPGMKALKELEIKSPLMEKAFTKEDIRRLSKELNLSTWQKPAYACLLSRIPHGNEISMEELSRIERAERYLMKIGFRAIRVRAHGELARIEIKKDEFKNILNEEIMEVIDYKFKEYGFKYVTLDMGGYRLSGLKTPQK